MSNPIAKSPMYDALQQLKSEIFKGLRVCLPGSIAEINADGTIDVTINLMQNVPQQGTFAGTPIPYPQISSCPLITLQGGGVGVVMPIKVGDECLVIFADRCIDNWFSTGAPQPLPNLRMHDISDGFALVGINSTPKLLKTPLSANEGGICETKNLTGAKVVIDVMTHKIQVANATQNLEMILSLLLTTLTTLNAALSSMTTASIASGTTQTAIAALSSTLTTISTSISVLLY